MGKKPVFMNMGSRMRAIDALMTKKLRGTVSMKRSIASSA